MAGQSTSVRVYVYPSEAPLIICLGLSASHASPVFVRAGLPTGGPLWASQECRRVGARSSPRPNGVWGEKNAPVVPTMGMCGPSALGPAGPYA